MSLAEKLIEQLLAERVSKDPYFRALDRIQDLQDKGRDVEKHTMLRLKKTSNADKVLGLFWASSEFGLSKVKKAAKAKYKELTGENPPKR